MNFLELWNRFCVEQREKARIDKFRTLSTDELKALWGAFNPDAELGEPGYFWPDDGPHVEDVYKILNERGEGRHCPI